MRYINHIGEVIDFGAGNILINENDFRNYSWKHTALYSKIAYFSKDIVTKSLPVIVYGEKRIETANRIYEIIERDVIGEKMGKMCIGDYYIKGYFYASEKEEYTSSNSITIKLKFISDQENWIKENLYTYRLNDLVENDRGLGYAYGYPYDFLSSINTQNLYNTFFADANLILRIYGPVINPSITIADNMYQVNTELLANEYLTINTLEKTIIKTTSKGAEINEYAKRSLANYVFKKIPAGTNNVVANPDCNFDIVIIEERSEPKWI